MVADSRHREKTFIIKEKKLESTILFQSQKKNLWNREKKYGIEKKKLKSRKIFRNWENKFRIEKNISESRKIFQNRENCFRMKNYFVRKIEKKSLELNFSTTFLYNSFIGCVHLVTVKSWFAQNVALRLEVNTISVLHVVIKQGLS